MPLEHAMSPFSAASPEETVRDDVFYSIPRPRPAVSIATIWAIDEFIAENGATLVVRGSHRWGDDEARAAMRETDFESRPGHVRGLHPRRLLEES